MKIFFIVTVGRQIEGEMITIRFDKAFKQASQADEYYKQNAKMTNETIKTPNGPMEFLCERGIHEVELED